MSKLFNELGGSETDKIEAEGQRYKDSQNPILDVLKTIDRAVDSALTHKKAMESISQSLNGIKQVIGRSKEWEKRSKTNYGKFTFHSEGGTKYTF